MHDNSGRDSIGPGNRNATRPVIRGYSGVISTGHPLAAQAGYQMYNQGGNAIDAGVAAGLVVNVVHHDMTSLGGVAPIILYSAAEDRVETISGLGRWPAAADRAYFEEHHDGEIPWGLSRSVVPAAADAWLTALERHGRLSLETVAEPAIRCAADGYAVYEFQHENLAAGKDLYAMFDSTAEIFLPDGDVPAVGDQIAQPDLARTLERLVEAETDGRAGGDREQGIRTARDLFYNGEIAETIGEFSEANGGLLTTQDLEDFSVGLEDPVHVEYRGLDVYTCGPWCQGPVFAQVLTILEGFDLQAMGHNSPAYLHTILEALKLAYADREWHYGDPEFVDVPMDDLVSDSYAADRAAMIDPERAAPELPPPGTTASHTPDPYSLDHLETAPTDTSLFHQDTSYVATIDEEGNVFSATPSDGCGGTPMVPGLGIPISTRGKQTRLDPRHPSSLEPRKRPRLTPNPALVLKDGEPFMAIGTPGGDVQPQAMLQVFLNQLEFGMNPQEAIEAPRVATYSFPATSAPHDYFPGVSAGEDSIPEPVFDALRDRGHEMLRWERTFRAGGVNIAKRESDTGLLLAGADPRRENYALGE